MLLFVSLGGGDSLSTRPGRSRPPFLCKVPAWRCGRYPPPHWIGLPRKPCRNATQSLVGGVGEPANPDRTLHLPANQARPSGPSARGETPAEGAAAAAAPAAGPRPLPLGLSTAACNRSSLAPAFDRPSAFNRPRQQTGQSAVDPLRPDLSQHPRYAGAAPLASVLDPGGHEGRREGGRAARRCRGRGDVPLCETQRAGPSGHDDSRSSSTSRPPCPGCLTVQARWWWCRRGCGTTLWRSTAA